MTAADRSLAVAAFDHKLLTEEFRMTHQTEAGEELRSRLNTETARIGWRDLQRFYAQGQVLLVDDHLDLIEVAASVAEDKAELVRGWMEARQLSQPDADCAQQWYDEERQLWAVVVAPWVLVQREKAATH